MILKIGIGLAILAAVILVLAATKPNTFRIQRSVVIHASAERVFPLIDDFHNWTRWAPQDKDPTMKRTFSGPAKGEGAVSEWVGAGSTGQGKMSIVKSVPPRNASVLVDWVKPFVAQNLNEFTLEPQGESTKVTWTMQGPNLFVMKTMGVFVNMDRQMGKHFETGLNNLKTVAEE